MSCIDYMRNFFNDHAFKVHAYAQLVPPVVQMGTNMLSKSVSLNTEAANEILNLFLFIVDKYAAMTLPLGENSTVNDFLMAHLRELWTHYVGKLAAQEGADLSEAYGEESIALHNVLRILNQLVVVSAHRPSVVTLSVAARQFKRPVG